MHIKKYQDKVVPLFMRKRIVCFGDSNTWGLNAETMRRFPEEVRWPCLLQEKLGDEYQIIEEGLPGRTSVMDEIGRAHV